MPSNKDYLSCVLADPRFAAGETTTSFLKELDFSPHGIEVVEPGMNSTVQVRRIAPIKLRGLFLRLVARNFTIFGVQGNCLFSLSNELLQTPGTSCMFVLAPCSSAAHRPHDCDTVLSEMGCRLQCCLLTKLRLVDAMDCISSRLTLNPNPYMRMPKF